MSMSTSVRTGRAERSIAFALSIMAVMCVSVGSVHALDRSEGDFWTYEGDMSFGDIAMTGEFRYEFEGTEPVTVGADTYEADVLKMTGSMWGTTEDYLGLSASVGMVFDGFFFEVRGSIASVKEDMHTWTNLTVGIGSLANTSLVETHNVLTYSPPLLSGVVPCDMSAGDEWDETVNVSSVSTTWVDGLVDESSTYNYSEAYSCSVVATDESVETGAGTFECVRLELTDRFGGQEVYWYSSEVGRWVKMSASMAGVVPSPYLALELTEYSYSDDSLPTLVVAAGLAVMAAVVIVVVLLLMRRRGRPAVEPPPEAPPRQEGPYFDRGV